jgi:opacity protein-like surface antigen
MALSGFRWFSFTGELKIPYFEAMQGDLPMGASMRYVAILTGMCVFAAWPADAAAAPTEAGEYRVAVTPVVGYRMGGEISDDETDDEVELDDDSMFGFILNVPYQSVGGDAYTEWEFYYSHQSVGVDRVPTGVDPSLDVDIDYFLIGGTYVGAGEHVRPYLAAEIGAANLSPDGPDYDSDTVFAFSIGAGAQVRPADRVGARLEARVLGAVIDSDSALFCSSASGGASCAFRASGDVLWQWELSAGATFRF